jgi:UDP-N-acetylmuramoyl-L-alanyl-D-glutamate--2,6-diaminopimelate ligase
MIAPIATRDVIEALVASGELMAVHGSLPARFADVTDDSRVVVPGALFVARRGPGVDGHRYVVDAMRAGATAAVIESGNAAPDAAFIVRDCRRALALVAAIATAHPARELAMVGVTGTNGKTTTVGMLRHLLDQPANSTASIGTLGVLVGSSGEPMTGGGGLTTPGVVELQRTLRALVDRGVRRVAMEVSSHSLDQGRVDGVPFIAAVFTNVSRDHLDYHGTMDAYVRAKAQLLDHLAPDGIAVINADEPAWSVLGSAPRAVRFGLDGPAAVSAAGVRRTASGSEWNLCTPDGEAAVHLPLLGGFNVANALAAAACAWALGMPVGVIAERLASMPQVPGRLERLLDEPTVLRDYAHTPDALDRALEAVRPYALGRVIVAFGCGGDRDRGKRPQMGAVAEARADIVILTSDNPRTEDPESILDEIEGGMRGSSHERIEDRRTAIARALGLARAGDIVVLAGKGHETYQVRGTTSYPFDEAVIVRELAAAVRPA